MVKKAGMLKAKSLKKHHSNSDHKERVTLIRLPKGKGSTKWEDEFDDADWDELDEDKDKELKVKAEDLEDEDEAGMEDDWDDEDDEDDDDDDIGALMKGLDVHG